jgi:hypothetical protein
MGAVRENPVVEAAMNYHRLGWCIIPIPQGKKAARIRWKQYQAKRPTGEQVRKWFAGNNRNIAVVLGGVSGGLACRDFDTEQAYQQWAGEHRDLADKLPTVKTARGYHVYFLADVDGIRDFDNGELRGGGGYCLLPPSVHPDGVIYEWLIETNGENLLSLKPDIFLPSSDTEQTEQTEQTEKTQQTQENSSNGKKGGKTTKVLRVCVSDFGKIIERTLPKKTGSRNRKVFELARALRSLPDYADADPKIFEPVVRQWHRQALPNIRTQDFEETWIDFLKAWPKIRWKVGDSPMGDTFERAKGLPVPELAAHYDNPKLRLLAAWCKVLAEQAKDGSFFLSTRTAGKYLDVEPMTANRWLFLLEQDRILEVVEKGKLTRAGGIATRFRYIAN